MKKNIVKKLWEELTGQEQTEFIKQMDFCGSDIRLKTMHIYQLNKDVKLVKNRCHGWIELYRDQYLKSIAKNPYNETN